MSRFPEKLETARLVLRLPEVDDAEALNDAITRSFAELSPWMDWAMKPQTIAETEAFCRESRVVWEQETALNCLMVERESGEMLGSCGYPRVDWSVPKFEIGYWCRSDRVGRGYVSEASWALASFAFEALDARRVELKMDDRNTRSWKVAARLGFCHEATLRNEVRSPRGELRDTRIYAATDLTQLLDPSAWLG
jgi:RimJ/RimL family protein N-acetyltransferase